MGARLARLFLVLLLAAACRTPQGSGSPPLEEKKQPPAEGAPIRITVVATNDLHGWVQPHLTKLAEGAEVEEGGLANFAGYVKVLREDNPGGVLLLDSGDLFQGTLAANLTEGAVVIDAYNHLGYAAAAIGNHEFDYGPDGPVSVAAKPGLDPFGALKARLKQAKFPLLAVNIYEAKSGERPAWMGNDGTLMVEVKGVKVGVFGLVTPSTPTVTNPVNVSTLRFGSLVPEAADAAKKLRGKGAEVVIAVAHAGGKCDGFGDPQDVSKCESSGEILQMLNGLPPRALDAVLAGHIHAPIGHFVNGTPVVQTFGLGRTFSTIELYLDPKRRALLPEKTALKAGIPICGNVEEASGSCEGRKLKDRPGVKLLAPTFLGKEVKKDAELAKLLSPALAQVEAEQQRKLGIVSPRPMGRNYEAESALGSFLADSLREMEQADVSLLNSGGLRADLPAGELRYGEVYEVLPFDNTVATVVVTGEELHRLLHAAYGAKKGVFQLSGLKVKLSRCPGRDRLRGYTLPDGKAVQPDKKYRVVVPDFLARGGDGLGPVLSTLPVGRIDFGSERELNFRDALVAFWQRKKAELVAPKLGRIGFLDDGASCSAAAKIDGQSGQP
ncbi:MAG: bifunctional metallophosphatase/5'-nucleotidase [Myxococcales bacterium]|nr:bifunctional metallophosphatase/5'-nucleotidase [Myxococcales bacterium]